jgi:hypothetical protein
VLQLRLVKQRYTMEGLVRYDKTLSRLLMMMMML